MSTLDTNTDYKTLSVIDIAEEDIEAQRHIQIYPKKNQLSDAGVEILNIPILISKNHFVITIIDLKLKTWSYFDPNGLTIPRKIAKQMVEYASTLGVYKEMIIDHQKQKDGWSCGLHCCIVNIR